MLPQIHTGRLLGEGLNTTTRASILNHKLISCIGLIAELSAPNAEQIVNATLTQMFLLNGAVKISRLVGQDKIELVISAGW